MSAVFIEFLTIVFLCVSLVFISNSYSHANSDSISSIGLLYLRQEKRAYKQLPYVTVKMELTLEEMSLDAEIDISEPNRTPSGNHSAINWF